MKHKSKARKVFDFFAYIWMSIYVGFLLFLILPIPVVIIMDFFTSPPVSARKAVTRAQLHSIQTALLAFKLNVGRYPTTEEGLQALITCPKDVSDEQWESPYLEEIPTDSWENDFIYKCPGKHGKDYDLYSPGPDEKEETEDDITNWKKEAADL